jgi:Protein of unknown function (DUF2992)
MEYTPNQISSTITIMFDGKWWMALFERRDITGYSVAKATISLGEPQGYQIENFLRKLDRSKLQFTAPTDEPILTRQVVVEKKQKFEKTHIAEVPLKNIHGTAKMLLQDLKHQNKIERKQKESAEQKQLEQYKFEVKQDKKLNKQKGR